MAMAVILTVFAIFIISFMAWVHYDHLALKQRVQLFDEFEVVINPESLLDEWRKTIKYCNAIERVSHASHRRALILGQNWRALYESELEKEGLIGEQSIQPER